METTYWLIIGVFFAFVMSCILWGVSRVDEAEGKAAAEKEAFLSFLTDIFSLKSKLSKIKFQDSG